MNQKKNPAFAGFCHFTERTVLLLSLCFFFASRCSRCCDQIVPVVRLASGNPPAVTLPLPRVIVRPITTHTRTVKKKQ